MRRHADLDNPVYVAWTAFLREAEQWSEDEIAAYQLQQLREIVRHAAMQTTGYRRRFEEAGVDPDSIQHLDDIRRLPMIDKETLRDHLEEFSAPWPGREYVTTGGSTGIPFGFYRNPDAFARELASKAHQYYRIGWREGDPQLVFRGLPIDSPDHMEFVERFNELRCSSYHLIPEVMEQYRQRALTYRPKWLRCYPSSGTLFARWLKESGREFPPIQGILCASENLYDYQRDLLREVFGARVFSHYGHYELAVLAGYCEYEDTYHVLPFYGYAELVDRAGNPVTTPGQVGEIVATSFLMKATPFIRYRTRDFAVYGGRGCRSCGRPYDIWTRIEGRLQEFIVTATGRLISMTAINFHDDIFDAVQQFQFYQNAPGRVTLRLVPRPEGVSEEVLADIRRRLLVKLGNDVDLTFELVESIPLTKRGKHRFLIQDLPIADHDAGDLSVWEVAGAAK
ncbi:MAG: phenylacetate--CoA ligase family protein [Chloroflexota bacterium]|nr:phenylacetate--CoA ligase family protein [Dehalococcoidia bacterium]MDW8252654.1 phenylacetate--CoA ligase family protein [Chloroflexota bacterium]